MFIRNVGNVGIGETINMRFIRSMLAGLLAFAFLSSSANLRAVFSQNPATPPAILDGFTPEGSTANAAGKMNFALCLRPLPPVNICDA